MRARRVGDRFEWRGCEAVRFDPEKLGGRATALSTRMDADGIGNKSRDGRSEEEIREAFGTLERSTPGSDEVLGIVPLTRRQTRGERGR